MCLILRENAYATSGRATLGDPRGVGELAGTATGYAFVLHGFVRMFVLFEGFGLAALGWPTWRHAYTLGRYRVRAVTQWVCTLWSRRECYKADEVCVLYHNASDISAMCECSLIP
eukprot:scaffold91268_cov68-Phaeocystis_antarctica.AAC.2